MKFNKEKKINWDKIEDKLVNIIACPIRPIYKLAVYTENKIDNRRKWSGEKAQKVLNKILPKVLDYVEEDNAFYYCMSWSEWGLVDNAPLVYYKWVKKFKYNLHDFIRNKYKNEDYEKTIENDGYGEWIKFTEK